MYDLHAWGRAPSPVSHTIIIALLVEIPFLHLHPCGRYPQPMFGRWLMLVFHCLKVIPNIFQVDTSSDNPGGSLVISWDRHFNCTTNRWLTLVAFGGVLLVWEARVEDGSSWECHRGKSFCMCVCVFDLWSLYIITVYPCLFLGGWLRE